MNQLDALKIAAWERIRKIENLQIELKKINEEIYKLENDGSIAIHSGQA